MNSIKMSMICTIQMLEDAINISNKHEFETFEKMGYADLEKYRDELIPIYNDIIKEKQNED